MLTHSQKIIEGYKDIVKDQQQIIKDYEDLLKMVQEDRDNKRSQLDMSEYKVRELEEENKQLRRLLVAKFKEANKEIELTELDIRI